MLNHTAYALACRNKALALQVCTTGSTTLSATTNTIQRKAGSFLTDGFAVGMEITLAGFATVNPPPIHITALAALVMTVDATLTPEPAAAAHTVSVGLPSQRAWENRDLNPANPTAYVTEQYLPGPTTKLTTGPTGVLVAEPQYVLTLVGPANVGLTALSATADALLTLFAPTTNLALASGDTLRVRGDVAPYRGQLVPHAPGWSRVPVTIPLRCYTSNSI